MDRGLNAGGATVHKDTPGAIPCGITAVITSGSGNDRCRLLANDKIKVKLAPT